MGEKSAIAARRTRRAVDRHGRRLVRRVLRHALAAAIILAGFGLFATIVSWSGDQAPHPSPHLRLEPIGGSSLIGVYGALAATIISLQVGILELRGIRGRKDRLRSAGSRELLGNLADASAVASLGMGILVVLWASNDPRQIDVLRTLGPGVVSIGLAFLAADAAIVASTRSPSDRDEATREAAVASLERSVSKVPGRPLGTRGRVTQAVTLFGVLPLALTVVSGVARPASSGAHFAGRVLVILIVTLLAAAAIRYVTSLMLAERSLAWVVQLVPLMGVAVVYELEVITSSLRPTSTGQLDIDYLAQGVLTFGLFVLAAPFVAAGVFALPPRAGGQRSLILDSVTRGFERRTGRMKRARETEPRRPIDRLALAGIWLVPVVPIGALAASFALARVDPADRRSRAVATVALVGSGVVVLAAVGVSVFLAAGSWVLDWCNASESFVCIEPG